MFFTDRYNLTVIGQHYHFMTSSDRFPVPVRSAVKSEWECLGLYRRTTAFHTEPKD